MDLDNQRSEMSLIAGRQLRKLREAKGVSTTLLSQVIGIESHIVEAFEGGNTLYTLTNAQLVAAAWARYLKGSIWKTGYTERDLLQVAKTAIGTRNAITFKCFWAVNLAVGKDVVVPFQLNELRERCLGAILHRLAQVEGCNWGSITARELALKLDASEVRISRLLSGESPRLVTSEVQALARYITPPAPLQLLPWVWQGDFCHKIARTVTGDTAPFREDELLLLRACVHPSLFQ